MTGAAAAAMATPERADLKVWLAVLAGTIGALMAVLDISIVNSSLPTIQGEIGATQSEASWIATSYLVAEIVVIPLSGWLLRLLGLRNLLLTATLLFTVFSIVCGMATSLGWMIFGRTGQGLAGGLLIPISLTVIATRLPSSQQPIGMVIFGGSVVMGPIIGPILGGWLTEQFSWHLAFLINVPVCAAVVAMVLASLAPSRANFHLLPEADWLGVVGMTLWLGAMTVVLEEGHRELWFDSPMIRWLTLLSVLGFAMLVAGQRLAAHPVVRFRLLRDRSFAIAVFLSAVNGASFIVPPFLMPQVLTLTADYNALQAGMVMVPLGVASALSQPVQMWLMTRVDARPMIALGLVFCASACWLNTGLTVRTTGPDLTLAQILLGIGIATTFQFVNQAVLALAPPEDTADASSIFNAMRNLGGSIMLAVAVTMLDQRQHHHYQVIATALPANSGEVQDRLSGIAAMLDGGAGDGAERALRVIDAQIAQQAAVMAFNDAFLLIFALILVGLALVPLMRPVRSRAVAAMH